MIEVDARGFSCPVPVVKTVKAINDNPNKEIAVLVETTVAKENVSRIAESKGYKVKIEETDDGFRLLLSPNAKN
jgi:tRNA 2-thiouridine synthesizing protein A